MPIRRPSRLRKAADQPLACDTIMRLPGRSGPCPLCLPRPLSGSSGWQPMSTDVYESRIHRAERSRGTQLGDSDTCRPTQPRCARRHRGRWHYGHRNLVARGTTPTGHGSAARRRARPPAPAVLKLRRITATSEQRATEPSRAMIARGPIMRSACPWASQLEYPRGSCAADRRAHR
jgi:hypothetical protein